MRLRTKNLNVLNPTYIEILNLFQFLFAYYRQINVLISFTLDLSILSRKSPLTIKGTFICESWLTVTLSDIHTCMEKKLHHGGAVAKLVGKEKYQYPNLLCMFFDSLCRPESLHMFTSGLTLKS